MLESANTEQAMLILAAARAVVDVPGRVDDARSGLGDALLVAAGRILFTPPVDVDPAALGHVEPQELARAIGADIALARHAAALIAVASLADGRAEPQRLRLVVEYAHAMHVNEPWVRDVLEIARGHLGWAMADMARRNVDTFPGLGRGDSTLPDMQPYRSGSDADKALAERFLGLEGYPTASFGHQLWAHFRRHGFAFPGEPTAFAEHFAIPHDGLHVLSGYSTSLPGELLVSTFTGAMHGRDALRAHILPVIFEWHVGHEVNGIGAQRGALDPRRFLIAWKRGSATVGDVLDPGWDFWAVASFDLEELRLRYGIPALDPVDAAIGPEITVPGRADPDAH